MKKLKLGLAAVFLISLAGCASPTVKLNTQFDAAEAKKLMEKGNNAIEGNAFLRQRGGGVVTCSGMTVQLVPATAYATERALSYFGTTESGFAADEGIFNKKMPPRPADYDKYSKTTVCDSEGRFKFKDLSDGTYYVTTSITWMTGDYSRQGGLLLKRVYLQDGETAEVIMSQ
ncbi:hypothetical protein G3479_11575 [Shewanella baltica]|uniref:hypothetical protein n=1 Tax=Shewanella baltica TaxID=62322 RepID=UPI00217E0521|nr:hypothetical protein [Shewanella baltica]MCS6259885.1 hypothetical protein [Shewanella baltica]